jgi:transcriptional regulator with XRE-family HTH domain
MRTDESDRGGGDQWHGVHGQKEVAAAIVSFHHSVASFAQSGVGGSSSPCWARRYAGHGHLKPHARHLPWRSTAHRRDRRCRSALARSASRNCWSIAHRPLSGTRRACSPGTRETHGMRRTRTAEHLRGRLRGRLFVRERSRCVRYRDSMNERLRTAMLRSGMDPAGLAEATGVDAKTVSRWLGGRTPHRRSRVLIAQKLGEDEGALWPSVRPDQRPGGPATAEVLGAWAHRADVPTDLWMALLTGAQSRVDLLGYAYPFLFELAPQATTLIADKCRQGTRVRIAVADPDCQHVAERDALEQLSGPCLAGSAWRFCGSRTWRRQHPTPRSVCAPSTSTTRCSGSTTR